MLSIETIIAMIVAYLFGSISCAIIVCKIMRLSDPRTQGSRNPGATNVLRIGGKFPAIVTLFGDMLKGVLPVLAAKWYGLPMDVLSLVAAAAFIGHLFPIFFGFEGGKGVATFIGCLLALSWQSGVAWIATWLVIALLTRYASLASMVASILAPIYVGYMTENLFAALIIALMTVILIYRHHSNIANLIAGNERKIGKKS